MQHVIFVIFAIIVFSVAVYLLVQYGMLDDLFVGFGQSTSTATSGTQARTSQQQQTPVQTQSANNTSISSPPAFYGQLNLKPSDIPAGFSLRDISPYFGKIRVSASPGSPGFFSQIAISTNLPAGSDPLNVTGWLLKGNRGSQYIPKAVEVYNPSGLTPEGDIRLKNGDTLTIYSTASAVGVNLRMNKCIGYLANTNRFTPQLNFNCPALNRSDIIGFTSPCQSYILSLNSCQMPAPNPPIPFNDFGCQAYLNNLNYGGCFSKHRNDFDFLNNQWNVWSGTHFLDFQHDRLLLFDKSGLLVSEYIY